MSIRRLFGCLAVGIAIFAARPAAADFAEGVDALQKKQYAVALDQWQRAAETGDARSQYALGYLFQFGLGTPPDNNQALAWYEKAAAQSNPDAQLALGLMYESGRAGKRNRDKAIGFYKLAAASGHSPDAEYALGRIYFRGQGVPRDENLGLTWVIKAANDGQPGAQYLLGEAYEVGGILKADKIDAYYWYTAALAGDEVVLREADPEFNPRKAIAVLMQHMTRAEIATGNEKLAKTPPPVAPEPSMSAQPKG